MRIFQLPNFKTAILGRSDPLNSMHTDDVIRNPIYTRVVQETSQKVQFLKETVIRIPTVIQKFPFFISSPSVCARSLCHSDRLT